MSFQQITYYRAYLVQDVELTICSGHYPETKIIACFDTKTEADTFCANLIKAATLIGSYGFYSEYRMVVQDYQIEPSLYISPSSQELVSRMLNPKPDDNGYYEGVFIKPEENRAVWFKGNPYYHGVWRNGKWDCYLEPGMKFFHEAPVKWEYVDKTA